MSGNNLVLYRDATLQDVLDAQNCEYVVRFQYSLDGVAYFDIAFGTKYPFSFSQLLEMKFRQVIDVKTVKIFGVDVPTPFTPSVGEKYYYIDSNYTKGYSSCEFTNDEYDKGYMQFGAWRTEEEVKLVVDAMRGIYDV